MTVCKNAHLDGKDTKNKEMITQQVRVMVPHGRYCAAPERGCDWDLAHGKDIWVGWHSSVFSDHRGGYFIITICLFYEIL